MSLYPAHYRSRFWICPPLRGLMVSWYYLTWFAAVTPVNTVTIPGMIVVLMGVTGSGKTTVGRTLAKGLGWKYLDADEFHPAQNVAKMRAGVPLNDADRQPWLDHLARTISESLQAGDSAVLACSALKQTYRDTLSIGNEVCFVYLNGDRETIAQRLRERSDHYMNPKLLDSQFDTLEEPKDALEVDATLPVDEIVQKIRAALEI